MRRALQPAVVGEKLSQEKGGAAMGKTGRRALSRNPVPDQNIADSDCRRTTLAFLCIVLRAREVPVLGFGVMHKTLASLLSLAIIAVVCGYPARAQQVAAETPKDELSAQIRLQGFACEKALGATRDKKRSRPDYAVWVLKCSNATYRVSRAPDMAAKVELLR